jgi:hypothetical protein
MDCFDLTDRRKRGEGPPGHDRSPPTVVPCGRRPPRSRPSPVRSPRPKSCTGGHSAPPAGKPAPRKSLSQADQPDRVIIIGGTWALRVSQPLPMKLTGKVESFPISRHSPDSAEIVKQHLRGASLVQVSSGLPGRSVRCLKSLKAMRPRRAFPADYAPPSRRLRCRPLTGYPAQPGAARTAHAPGRQRAQEPLPAWPACCLGK